MTSITWAGPRYVQELGTFLGPENRTQRRCEVINRVDENVWPVCVGVTWTAIKGFRYRHVPWVQYG